MDEGVRQKLPLNLIALLVAVAFVAGGIAGAGASLILGGGDSNTDESSSRQPTSASVSSVEEAVAAVRPGVVIVVNEIAPSPSNDNQGGLGAGAGFIVDERGFVVTNEHIVHDPGKLTVVLSNGEHRSATVVATDAPYSDLAVLRIQSGGLTAVPIGRSEDLRLGETVIAIGSPDFDYDNTVTVGVVSGLERRKFIQGIFLEDLIQTDAAINLGNSGGPLINTKGEVVGVVTFRDVGGDNDLAGISFAISSRVMQPIVQSMVSRGSFPRPYFGVEHENGSRGARVASVSGGSPADRAGIRPGDVILRIGRNDISSALPFLNALGSLSPTDRVPVQLVRDGRPMEVTVELVPR